MLTGTVKFLTILITKLRPFSSSPTHTHIHAHSRHHTQIHNTTHMHIHTHTCMCVTVCVWVCVCECVCVCVWWDWRKMHVPSLVPRPYHPQRGSLSVSQSALGLVGSGNETSMYQLSSCTTDSVHVLVHYWVSFCKLDICTLWLHSYNRIIIKTHTYLPPHQQNPPGPCVCVCVVYVCVCVCRYLTLLSSCQQVVHRHTQHTHMHTFMLNTHNTGIYTCTHTHTLYTPAALWWWRVYLGEQPKRIWFWDLRV